MAYLIAAIVGLGVGFMAYIFGVFHGVEAIERKNRDFALRYEKMWGKRPEGWTYFTDLPVRLAQKR